MRLTLTLLLVLALLLSSGAATAAQGAPPPAELRFAVAADMRFFTTTPETFPGVLAALGGLPPTDFMITPGDMDPPAALRSLLDDSLGNSYRWLPVIGNHELPGAGTESSPGANLDWLRAWSGRQEFPQLHAGPAACPETTYSFDMAPVHFVALNEYCASGGDASTDGDISPQLYDWLAADLAAATQPYTFVIGHEPAYPQPDTDLGGPARHLGDSLDKYPENRDRFWALLAREGVTAYLTGHTHAFSAFYKDGVWQIDAGHARGTGDPTFPSTFLVIDVTSGAVLLRVYRGAADYTLRHTFVLVGKALYLPLVAR